MDGLLNYRSVGVCGVGVERGGGGACVAELAEVISEACMGGGGGGGGAVSGTRADSGAVCRPLLISTVNVLT